MDPTHHLIKAHPDATLPDKFRRRRQLKKVAGSTNDLESTNIRLASQSLRLFMAWAIIDGPCLRKGRRKVKDGEVFTPYECRAVIIVIIIIIIIMTSITVVPLAVTRARFPLHRLDRLGMMICSPTIGEKGEGKTTIRR